MNDEQFEAYVREHNLHATDHDRIWWTHENPDDRAWDSATHIAKEFPDLRLVCTESRHQTSDVQWQLSDDHSTVVLGYYPLNADKWDHEVIPEIRAALEDGEDDE